MEQEFPESYKVLFGSAEGKGAIGQAQRQTWAQALHVIQILIMPCYMWKGRDT